MRAESGASRGTPVFRRLSLGFSGWVLLHIDEAERYSGKCCGRLKSRAIARVSDFNHVSSDAPGFRGIRSFKYAVAGVYPR